MSDGNMRGAVKWFNKTKGYGFITVDGQVKDVFFHAKQWNVAAPGSLPVEGETLTFIIVNGEKGPFATDIARTGAPGVTGSSIGR